MVTLYEISPQLLRDHRSAEVKARRRPSVGRAKDTLI